MHVAIIMDGSGRWAEAKRRPRMDGHRAGANLVRDIVGKAAGMGVDTLTLFAFSADNWSRPQHEVRTLMALLCDFLRQVRDPYRRDGICVDIIGRRDRLSPELRDAIHDTVVATVSGTRLHVRLAVDYSSRDSIVRAAAACADTTDRESFRAALARADHATRTAPDVDLLIRTGGEQRLSDFLLWECAYAELVFLPLMWPDFRATDLEAALDEFHRRERRFGRVLHA